MSISNIIKKFKNQENLKWEDPLRAQATMMGEAIRKAQEEEMAKALWVSASASGLSSTSAALPQHSHSLNYPDLLNAKKMMYNSPTPSPGYTNYVMGEESAPKSNDINDIVSDIIREMKK